MVLRLLGGRYSLVQELGRGATAIVYRARDEHLGTEVAVKVMAPHLVRDAAAAARFERELVAAQQVKSEAVAQVYESGVEEGTRYVVMEYGPTGTLKDHLLLRGPLSAPLLDRLIEQIADALAACHGRGILHRDIKPSNILFDPESGRMKLIDFGVARVGDLADVEGAGCVVGTPEYMAPEQFDDPSPDPRSDLYAAGAVLYEAATGRPPVVGRTLPEIVRKHHEAVRVRPRDLNRSVGPGAEAIIVRLLAVDPGNRFQTAEELGRVVSGRAAKDEPPDVAAGTAGAGCPACGARREAGLPFCPLCTTSLSEFDRFGRWSVVVTSMPNPESLQRCLETSLPLQAIRAQGKPGRPRLRLPLTVLEFASEPMAKWLAEELRLAGLTASTRRLALLRALGVSAFSGVALGLLAQSALAGLVTRPESSLPLVVFGLFVSAAVAFVWEAYVHFGRALAYVHPLHGRADAGSLFQEARAAQARLRSSRYRAIGRDVLVTAHRLARAGARRGARQSAGDEMLATAYDLLVALDRDSVALRERHGSPERRASLADMQLRGTQVLLRLTSLWRREYAATVRSASGGLSRSLERLDRLAAEIETQRSELLEVLRELATLAPPSRSLAS